MKKYKENGTSASLVWFFLDGCRLMFVIAMITAALTAFADMLSPQIIRMTIDNVVCGKDGEYPGWVMTLVERFGGFEGLKERLWIMALAVMLVALVKVTMQYFFRVSSSRGAESLVKNMRDSLYAHIERLPFSWHMSNHTGDIIQRCTSDIEMVKNFISQQMVSLVRITIMLILSLSFMFPMSTALTLIALIPTVPMVWYSLQYYRRVSDRFRECDENEGVLSSIAQENLTGVRVVRAFGREKYERERFENHNEYYTGLWGKMAEVMSRYWSISDFLFGLQAILIVIFGAVFAINGRITPGEYVAFISYNSMLMGPIRMLGRMLSEMSKAGVSIERIKYIMDSSEEANEGRALMPEISGDIRFENVTFSYDGTNNILENVSFEMKAGTTLGILGGTGSGKSTAMLLLDKLYPLAADGGRITVDGIDIRDIDTLHLRKNIGFVLQDPFLFSCSIRDNIGIASDSFTEEQIVSAASAACLDETVRGFTKGYDTFVGERGVTLSGGQKQRTAIARTLMQNTPILIFDDSLSAVDTETDAKIRASLEKLFGKASVILISHRITTLSKADKIIVFDHGKISEQGTPEELKAGDGIYRRIYDIQSGIEEDVVNE